VQATSRPMHERARKNARRSLARVGRAGDLAIEILPLVEGNREKKREREMH